MLIADAEVFITKRYTQTLYTMLIADAEVFITDVSLAVSKGRKDMLTLNV